MAKVNKYNVYDDGKLILENATRGEIVKAIGCSTININGYAEKKLKYRSRYTFEFCKAEEIRTGFAKEWEDAVKMFKNVIWVKEGGRKLRVGMS